MNLNELRQRLSELEDFINSSKDLQRVLFDNPMLMTRKFEEENQQRIQEFLNAKKEVREIRLKLRTPKEIEEDMEIERRLREKYSDD